MLASLAVVRLVPPSILGLFNAVILVQSYIAPLHLGVPDGLARDLPLALGKGAIRTARAFAAAAAAWSGAISLAASAIALLLSMWFAAHGKWHHAIGWITNGVCFLSILYGSGHLQVTFKTSSEFRTLAKCAILEGLVLLAAVPLVALFGFFGLAARASLASGITLAFLWRNRPMRVTPRWSAPHIKRMLSIGFPILLNNACLMWWGALDRTLVLHWKGHEGLGLYSVCILLVGAMTQLPIAFAQVIYPRIAWDFGSGNGRAAAIHGAWRGCIIPFVSSSVIALAAWPMMPTLLRLLAPQYQGAAPALQWSLLLCVVLALTPSRVAFNVLLQQRKAFFTSLLGLATYLSALFALGAPRLELEDFPKALLAGRLVFFGTTGAMHWLELRRLRTPALS